MKIEHVIVVFILVDPDFGRLFSLMCYLGTLHSIILRAVITNDATRKP